MLRILTPEESHILSEIIVSPVQVVLATNNVVDDFPYQKNLSMNNMCGYTEGGGEGGRDLLEIPKSYGFL